MKQTVPVKIRQIIKSSVAALATRNGGERREAHRKDTRVHANTQRHNHLHLSRFGQEVQDAVRAR